MRRYRARQRAAGLRVVTRYEPPPRARLSARNLESRILEARDLALHCAAAKMIDSDRALLTTVRGRLEYWHRNYKDEQPPTVLDDWAEILSRPWTAMHFSSQAVIMLEQLEQLAKQNVRLEREIAVRWRRMRKRDGAFFWEVFQDSADAGRFTECFMKESWMKHLRQHERVTKADPRGTAMRGIVSARRGAAAGAPLDRCRPRLSSHSATPLPRKTSDTAAVTKQYQARLAPRGRVSSPILRFTATDSRRVIQASPPSPV